MSHVNMQEDIIKYLYCFRKCVTPLCLSEAPPPGKREEQLGIFFVTDHETHIIKIFFRICHRIYHVRKVPLRLMFQISHSQFI